MTNSNFRHGLWFFEKQRFLSRLPCGVYLSTVRNSTFVDRINDRPMKAMAKNHHFWRCLPIEYIRDMMKKTTIGRKLSIFTAIEACHAIRRVHNPDLEVCIYFDLNLCAIIFVAQVGLFIKGYCQLVRCGSIYCLGLVFVSFKKCVTEKRTVLLSIPFNYLP